MKIEDFNNQIGCDQPAASSGNQETSFANSPDANHNDQDYKDKVRIHLTIIFEDQKNDCVSMAKFDSMLQLSFIKAHAKGLDKTTPYSEVAHALLPIKQFQNLL